MLRVCGAEGERDALSAKRCWCGGLFCGRGGFRRTQEFRRLARNVSVARSRAEFDDLLRQVDLFDGDAPRARWVDRLRHHTRYGSEGSV